MVDVCSAFGRRAALDHPSQFDHNGPMTDDARRCAPSAPRNRDAILKALSPYLPELGRVLEVASGSGEHTMHLATAHPKLKLQPSDPDPDGRASPDAWTRHLGLTNVAPWSAAVGLMRNAAIVLPTGGLLYL
jgi:Protein of unknown function (DUF938)